MPVHPAYIESYDLGRIVLFGSSGSCGLISFVLLMAFVGSRVSSYHPPFSTDTIGEMMGWTTFFLFAFASYFTTAVLVWRQREFLSGLIVSWIPISFFGSLLFSISFLSWVWVFSVPSPDRTQPQSFWYVLLLALSGGFVCALIAATASAVVSAIVPSRAEDGINILTQKY